MTLFDSCYKNLWVEPVINADGTTIMCCHNFYKLFDSTPGFDNIIDKLNTPNIIKLRENFLNNHIEKIIYDKILQFPCKKCSTFRRHNHRDIEFFKRENLISREKFKTEHNELVNGYLSVENIKNICIDLTVFCQLKYPGCWRVGVNDIDVLSMGTITIDNFIKLLNQLPYLKMIHITNNGESLLHPQFAQIVDICRERNIIPTCYTGFNLNYLNEESAEALVRAQSDNITCSIDGASQETYSRYRVGGNLDKVLENVKLLNHYKKLYKSDKPTLYWKMIIFNWNIHEIDKARKMAEELEMKFVISHNTVSYLDILTKENQDIFDNLKDYKVNIGRFIPESQ